MFSCNVLLKPKFSFEALTAWFEKEKKRTNKQNHTQKPTKQQTEKTQNKQNPKNQMAPTLPLQIALQQ